MGLMKKLLDEPTWFLDTEKVCADCFEEEGIKQYINHHSDEKKCDFCDNQKGKSLTFSKLMDFIFGKISERYTSPNLANIPYARGFIFPGQEIEDLLFELNLGVKTNKVWEKVVGYLGYDNWIREDWNAPDNYILEFRWENFCDFVKTKKRFFFRKEESSKIISDLEKLIEENKLIKKLEPETIFYRARAFKKNEPKPEYNIKTFGPPKSEDIMNKSSRMSPAGIPLLYCSKEQKTAYKEILDSSKKCYYILVCPFKPKKPIYIVDFTKIKHRKIPSYFDENVSLETRDELIFLKDFSEEISKKIEKDGREHTEYVPTQIITEFLKDIKFKNHKIMGIGYKSAVTKGTSYALFFERGWHDEDLEPPNRLSFNYSSIKKINIQI